MNPTEILTSAGFEPDLVHELVQVGRQKNVKEGEIIISPAYPGNEMPIVLQGILKVMRQDTDGREIFLYFLEGGETCALSITCCLEGRPSSFKGEVEEDASLWMVPITYLDSWILKYESFRKFVFSSYHVRFDELLATIDSVVFTKMDERLYRYLLDAKQATGSYEIRKTHQQIARELNTSRVVVSRLLKQLEKEEKIEQHRNLIEIL